MEGKTQESSTITWLHEEKERGIYPPTLTHINSLKDDCDKFALITVEIDMIPTKLHQVLHVARRLLPRTPTLIPTLSVLLHDVCYLTISLHSQLYLSFTTMLALPAILCYLSCTARSQSHMLSNC